jgi:hypothetical protein
VFWVGSAHRVTQIYRDSPSVIRTSLATLDTPFSCGRGHDEL